MISEKVEKSADPGITTNKTPTTAIGLRFNLTPNADASRYTIAA